MNSNPTQGVISEAWQHYKSHWQHLVGIALLIYVVMAALSLLFVETLGIVGALLAAVVSIIGAFLVQGALAKAIEDIMDGKADMSFGETLSSARPFVGRIAGASLLAGLGIALGLVLLIVPGLVLLTWWSLIVPVIVFENTGAVESLGRSKRLVTGWAWQVFGIFLLMFLLLIGFGIVFGLVLVAFPDNVARFISDVLGGALTAPFVALVAIILYGRLRRLNAPPQTSPSPDTSLEPGPPPPS